MSLRDLLDRLPAAIVQAPMLSATGAEMTLAVCRAGGLGMFAGGGSAPEELGPAIAGLKAASDAPFGVNLLMAPRARPGPGEVDRALDQLAPWYAAIGAPNCSLARRMMSR